MRWQIDVVPGGLSGSADGADAELVWQVEDRHVGQQTGVVISVATDSVHHRLEGTVEGRAIFFYRVLPR